MQIQYGMVLTTVDNLEVEQNIIQALLQQELAACIQVMPITSHYRWQGQLECSQEKLLLIKIKQPDYSLVEKVIVEQHYYDTPQVVMLPIEAGFASYLDWINQVTR